MALVTTTKATMDAYFGINNDVRHWEYVSFSDGLRTAAFNQAVRELESVLGRTLSDPTTTSDTVERVDYAIYEQALWTLENTTVTKGDDGGAVVDLAKDEQFDTIQRKELILAPKARRYLRMDFIKIARG